MPAECQIGRPVSAEQGTRVESHQSSIAAKPNDRSQRGIEDLPKD